MNKRKPFWGGGYVKKTKQNEKIGITMGNTINIKSAYKLF